MKQILKTVVCYVLFIVMVLVLAQSINLSAAYEGSGTKDDPYIVNTEAELIYYLENYNTADVHISINNDLTLTSNYIPADLYATIDGGFHTITALTHFINSNHGVIKNMIYIDTVKRVNTPLYRAGIVCNENYGTISGVIATGYIENDCFHTSSGDNDRDTAPYAGIIAGYSDNSNSKIINCAAFGSISLDCKYGSHAGGITSYGKVTNCYASVKVVASGSSRYGTSSDDALTLGISENSYYNKEMYNSTGGYTASEMKTQEFVDRLNSNIVETDSKWVMDTNNVNDGFPILTAHFDAQISSSKTNVLINGTEEIVLTSSEPNLPIYYTLDGSEPTKQSKVFSGKITISGETTIKAVVYKKDLPSNIYTFVYAKPQGLGTKDSPYIVHSEGSLFAIAEMDKNAYYQMTNDITLTKDLTCLGDFYGIFDGNGYSINGVYNGAKILGLFNKNYGVIQNVTLNIKDGIKYHAYGSITKTNYGVISNVKVKGNLEGGTFYSDTDGEDFGGIAAVNYGTIELCTFEGYIHAMKLKNAGGIVGQNFGNITYCMFKGDIYIESISSGGSYQGYVGGIAGKNDSTEQYIGSYEYEFCSGSIRYCLVSGYIKSTPSNYTGVIVGAIAGYDGRDINFCVEEATVYASINYLEWGQMGTNEYTGFEITGFVQKPHEHEFSISYDEPICGFKVRANITCSCGLTQESYLTNTTGYTRHDYTDAEEFVIKEATCFEVGVKGKKCNQCDYIEEETFIPILHEETKELIDSSLYPSIKYENSSNSPKTLTFEHEGAAAIEIVFSSKSTLSYSYDYLYVYGKNNKQIARFSYKEMADQKVIIPGDKVRVSISMNSSYSSYDISFASISVYNICASEWETVKEATCTEMGLKERHCLICGAVQSQQIAKLSHNLVYDILEPTCLEDGYKVSTCQDCSYTETVYYYPTGHQYSAVKTEPTCTEQGYTTHTCKCGDTYVNSYTNPKHDLIIDSKVAATCTATGLTQGSHCSRCDYVIPQEIIPMIDHKYTQSAVTLPTCTEQGYTTHTCVCGDYYIDTYVDPVHDMIIDEAVAATCTTTGLTQGSHCSRCDYVIPQESTPMIDHEYTRYVTTLPTCTEQGYTTHYCYCGASINDTYVDSLGHRKIIGTKEYHTPVSLKNDATYPFGSSGNSYWSTNKAHNSDSYFTITALYDYTITISYYTSSETNYDKLIIRLNGSDLYSTSGETSTITKNIPLKKGDVLTINYHKDSSVSKYDDEGCFTLKYSDIEIDNTELVSCDGFEPTCTEAVYCDVCDDVAKKALGHSYESQITPATCETRGYTTFTCHCGASYIGLYVDALGHKDGDAVVENNVDPTCTQTGYFDSVIYCSVCNKELSRKTVVVKALGHNEETLKGYAATCETTGLTDGKQCLTCGEILVAQEEINALGHKDGNAVVENNVDPTCTQAGSYDSVIYCSVCNKELSRKTVVVKALGHNEETLKGYAATCETTGLTDGKQCLTCSEILVAQEEISALGHKDGNAVVENNVDPTCSQAGSYDLVVYCSICNVELSREKVELEKLPHNEVVDEKVEPTCTETGLTEGSHCGICNEVFIAQETIFAKGHSAFRTVIENEVIATCAQIGSYDVVIYCGICDMDISRETVTFEKLPHSIVVDESVAATCEETGLTEGSHCDVCGEVLVAQEVLSALGHTEVVVPGKAATCEEAGLTDSAYCSVCEKVLLVQEEIEALGHSYQIKSDVFSHWNECSCGAKTDKENHFGGVADETNRAICEVCDTKYGEYVKNDDITAGCVGSSIPSLFSLLSLGGLVWVLKKKREE